MRVKQRVKMMKKLTQSLKANLRKFLSPTPPRTEDVPTAESGRRLDADESVNSRGVIEGRFCPKPFENFEVDQRGDVYMCCAAWLPKPVGNILRESADEIWNGDAAQEIRASIHDGSYKYCKAELCPQLQNGTLPEIKKLNPRAHRKPIAEAKAVTVDYDPMVINFCNDDSCNLSCPSCRTAKIMHTLGPEFDMAQTIQNKVVEAYLSKPTDRAFAINVTGSGDAFGSKTFRETLYNLNGADFPRLDVNLQTNGVMFTPTNWDRIKGIHGNINLVMISFDAATSQTYNITRRGGDFDRLVENCRFLADRYREGKIKRLRFDFVVQKDNYREMADFVRLARDIGPKRVIFSMIVDWGTWSRETFEDKAVWRKDHPEFEDLLAVLRDPIFDDEEFVDMGNLTELRALALKTAA